MKGIAQIEEGDPLSLVVSEIVPVPIPNDNDVIIKVELAGVNHLDLIQAKGLYKVPDNVSSVMGLEVYGSILTVGKNCVKGFKEGDKVMALVNGGGYAELCKAHEGSVFPEITSLDAAHNCALPEVCLTAYQMMAFVAKVRPNSSVLVHAAASSVSQMLIQMLVRRDVRVIGTTRTQSKTSLVLTAGAHEAIIPDDLHDGQNKRVSFAQKCIQANNNELFDCVFDPVGAYYLNENLDCLNTDGKLVLYALLNNDYPIDSTIFRKMLWKRVSITPTTLGSRDDYYKTQLVDAFCSDDKSGFPALQRGEIKVQVAAKFALEEVVQAHEMVRKGTHTGKVLLKVSENSNSLDWFAANLQNMSMVDRDLGDEVLGRDHEDREHEMLKFTTMSDAKELHRPHADQK